MKVDMNTYSVRPQFGMAVKAEERALNRIITTMKDEKDWQLFNRLVASQESNHSADVILTLEDEPDKLGERIIAKVGPHTIKEGETFFHSKIIDVVKKAVGFADEIRGKALDNEMKYSKYVAVNKIDKID